MRKHCKRTSPAGGRRLRVVTLHGKPTNPQTVVEVLVPDNRTAPFMVPLSLFTELVLSE